MQGLLPNILTLKSIGAPSLTSSWGKLLLPTYMSEIYCQARISAKESLILFNEKQESSKRKAFVIFNFQNKNFSRVDIENVDIAFHRISDPCYMLSEGNIIVVLEHNSELTLWKFKISQSNGEH